jgi:hypothetical protein
MRLGTRFVGSLAAGLAIVACGNTSSSGGVDAGAATGPGGTNMGSVPPASQGSFSIHFQLADIDASNRAELCLPGAHWTNAPPAPSIDRQTTGSTRAPNPLVDGEGGVQFSCKVLPEGDRFSVTADLSAPVLGNDAQPSPIAMRIKLTTRIGPGENGASGSLTVADFDTAWMPYTSDACSFSVMATSTDKKLAIDAGKAWGKVTCPTFDDPGVPQAKCSVDVGYFILENCL